MTDIFDLLAPKPDESMMEEILSLSNHGKRLSEFHHRLLDYGVRNLLNERGIEAMKCIHLALKSGSYNHEIELP
jgi:hypothetical protein